MVNKTLEKMERSELIQLIEIYSKNWLAMDGVWFQSVERKFGMAEAMEHDCNIWEAFTKIEAQKIKEFLKLSPRPGIDGLKRALQLRLYANINEDEIIVDGNTLIYRTLDCRMRESVRGWNFIPARQSVLLNILVLPRPLMTGLSAKRLAVIRK